MSLCETVQCVDYCSGQNIILVGLPVFIPLVDFEASREEEAKWQPSSHTPTEHGHQARQEIRWHEWTYVLLSVLLLSFASEGLVALCAANTEKISTPT